ncbi:Uncharacterised protein [Mycobacteroides abscessus]|nr:Uncharacterised protein [Mycobacteroides abscessus]
MSYDCEPPVCEPRGSVEALRQMPNGLMPNLTHGFACLMRCEMDCTNVSTLWRRQSSTRSKPAPWVAKVAASGIVSPATAYG